MRALPRKVEYPTLVKILTYLEASEKILLNGDSITWIFVDNPKLVKLLRESPVLKSRDTPSSRPT
jgi:sulfur transfer complex TusBCD TusB component (DsrH family)